MDKASLIRTIILAVALINQVLVSFDKSPLHFNDQQIDLIVSTVFTIVTALIAWYKNNYVTRKGLTQKAVLKMHEEQVKK
jgi:SPP1 family holin